MKSSSQPVESFHGACAVFLDRDGVINRKLVEGRYIRNWSECEILPGVEEAIASLNRRQCRVLVTTNQRGIALGLCTAEEVEDLHLKMQQHLAMYGAHVDRFYYCPHDEDQCDCRKPGTGLLERAVRDFPDITPETSVMIGDSLSDIKAAQKFGCRSIFIEGDPQTRKAGAETAERLADATAASLTDAVARLLQV